MILLGTASPAAAKDFVHGGRVMTCKEAVAYRDTSLFADYVSAMDAFDAQREKRIAAVMKEMEVHLAGVDKELRTHDARMRKRIAVSLAGLAMAYAGKYAATAHRTGLSKLEKKALESLADRASDWRSIFIKYATDPDYKPELSDAIAVPVGFAASFFPTADAAWKVGTTAIDVGGALAERYITVKEAKLTAELLRASIKNLVTKMRLPAIKELLAIKDAIDKQCR